MPGTVKKLQFSEGTDVGAPTDLGIASSTVVIQPYANDAAYVTANGPAASGSVYLNTTLDFFRYYTNGFWRNALTAEDQTDPTKLFRLDFSGQGTGRKTTLALSAASSDKIITLQNVTDTLIGRITPDQGASRVLNKDFDDATTFIVDSSDTTKKIGFNAGGTTGTKTTFAAAQTADRVISAPDATGTIVLNDNTATLSSKTLLNALLSGSLDVAAAGNFTIGGSVGANLLTLGGSTSTVVIAGDLTVQGNTTTINTATLDVEDVNITVNKGGNDASSQGSGLTVDRTGTKGSFVYDSGLTSRWKLGDLGSEIEAMTTTGSQSAQNKAITLSTIATTDIDGGTATNTSRITIPKAATATLNALTRKQATLVYDTTTSQVKVDDGSTLTALAFNTGGGNLTTDLSSTDTTVASGTTLFHPFLTIDTGFTYTINGQLVGIGNITVNGTLTINGTVEYV